jgi:hypothetical protein
MRSGNSEEGSNLGGDMKILATAVLVILTASSAARAPSLDLNSCHDDLDHLRRTVSDASDAAEEANSKLDDLEDCRRNPEFLHPLDDGCQNLQRDYQSAGDDLESNMDDVDAVLWSVQDSCGYQFTVNRMSALEASERRLETSKRHFCTSVKRLASMGMTPDTALQMCKANADEQWCKQCLGLK